ncbi:MAG: DUF87 domain-containing protein [Bacteroidia bacterium]|nr:DUF87 domain-containing protein [Bacteroidia bacterium]MDW8159727.1 DUF87 domain-containing protein [Bacteroidia bacterium]
MATISFNGIRQAEGLYENLQAIKQRIENRLNLEVHSPQYKPCTLSNHKIMRLCFLAGLAQKEPRRMEAIEAITLSKSNQKIFDTFFTWNDLSTFYSALLKLRYQPLNIDWEKENILVLKSKIIAYEIFQGAQWLLQENHLEEFLLQKGYLPQSNKSTKIPSLNLHIGVYEDNIDAYLNLNSKEIPNTQILIAGTTGSGKSNLIAVLLQQLRGISVDTAYPVNFLLLDYKGEFSDPSNEQWLSYFEVDRSCILDPIQQPLPFSPFRSFIGKSQNEINLYSTELANALCAIDNTRISANMSNRLSEAIIHAYKSTQNAPIHFEHILKHYTALQPEKEKEKDDSIKSVLKQLIRSNLFATEDQADLIRNSYIIKMDGFPKEGTLAKAIVYFIISKLNTIYEQLPKQAADEENVEIRHFTIIDEAHYMLDFDNRPLRELIAVGRNKGLSIILATQNMDSFKSEYFDFYANAQYPLIMKQQSMNDSIIKDIFGVSGRDFLEIKEAIASLQKGELIIKNPAAIALGLGRKYKKIKVRHLI